MSAKIVMKILPKFMKNHPRIAPEIRFLASLFHEFFWQRFGFHFGIILGGLGAGFWRNFRQFGDRRRIWRLQKGERKKERKKGGQNDGFTEGRGGGGEVPGSARRPKMEENGGRKPSFSALCFPGHFGKDLAAFFKIFYVYGGVVKMPFQMQNLVFSCRGWKPRFCRTALRSYADECQNLLEIL